RAGASCASTKPAPRRMRCGSRQLSVEPPSTTCSTPVTYDDASDKRKSTTDDTSSTVPGRRSDTRPVRSARSSSVLGAVYMPVSAMPPGWTELTRMPDGPRSFAALFVKPRTAHFDVAYDDNPTMPRNPAIDEMLTIEPPPAARIGSTTLVIPHHVPVTL